MVAFLASSWLAFAELGGHLLYKQCSLVLCYLYHKPDSKIPLASSFTDEETGLGYFG